MDDTVKKMITKEEFEKQVKTVRSDIENVSRKHEKALNDLKQRLEDSSLVIKENLDEEILKIHILIRESIHRELST